MTGGGVAGTVGLARAVLPQTPTGDPAAEKPSSEREHQPPGHGRNGAGRFTGARTVRVQHNNLHPGAICPECGVGKVYRQKEPKTLVRIVGRPPLEATRYEMERLRCNGCGEVYTADEPAEVGAEKYDETAAAMIAQLRYGSCVPFKRLERLEGNLGIPLPAATQWGIAEKAALGLGPMYDEYIRQAARGEVMHNDDTGMRILRLTREPADTRTGIFTSGIVSLGPGWKIALYFSGDKHAGENLAELLKRRPPGTGSLDPDVRRAVVEHLPSAGGGATPGVLYVARKTPVCGSGGELSRAMPVCAGNAGRHRAP